VNNMTFDEYWNKLIEKNPKMLNDTFNISSVKFKQILEQVYSKGKNHVDSFYEPPKNRNSDPLDQLMKAMGMYK